MLARHGVAHSNRTRTVPNRSLGTTSILMGDTRILPIVQKINVSEFRICEVPRLVPTY
jgi:hypothetical protein